MSRNWNTILYLLPLFKFAQKIYLQSYNLSINLYVHVYITSTLFAIPKLLKHYNEHEYEKKIMDALVGLYTRYFDRLHLTIWS